MSEFKIDKDVPMPRKQNGGTGNARFPLHQLEVGDSFCVPFEEGRESHKTRSVVSNAVAAFQLRNASKKFAVRKVDDGYRLWRTA